VPRRMTPSPTTAAGPQAGVILERGQAIDRFVVLGLVGRGGMGEVYAAYDPELDRKVAIKLLRARGDAADGRSRLFREAQAIAKLQHPNVVVVYDVGTFGQSVFIAMEFVEGRTVSGWLHAGARTRREIMDVYLAAGRGLAAAHAAGLVHRDFKPDNVMVTNDGQVRVMDFGLARQVAEAAGEAIAARKILEAAVADAPGGAAIDPEATLELGRRGTGTGVTTTSGKYLSVKLTQTGAMLGTPAYMAPEQFAVRPTDARTDQFSFCVALYEALYGKRPFEGDTFLALMTSVTTGAVSAPPAKARVPGWLRKVLLRGLATDPAARYPSMTALLAALATDPTIRLRRILGAVVVLACLAGAAAAARRVGGERSGLCRGGTERLAGVWETGGGASRRKDSVRRAFLATGVPYAEKAFDWASRNLDQYAEAWRAMYSDACEATHIRGEQSAEVLDLRMACLGERLTDLRALTDELAVANAKVVENAASAVGSLTLVERCADVKSLRAVVKPPADEATRRRVDQLREERARLTPLRFAAKCDEARRLVDGLIPAVKGVAYVPLVAETMLSKGLVEDVCGGSAEVALASYRESFLAALSAGLDQVAVQATTAAAFTLADRMRQLDQARQFQATARALLARVGGDAPLEADLNYSEGTILEYEGDVEGALAAFERARAEHERLRGRDHPFVVLALNGAGLTLMIGKQYERALDFFRRASEIMSRTLGPTHPYSAMLAGNAGEALNNLRRYGAARAFFERAVDGWAAIKAEPSIVAYAETGLGIALLGEGRSADALPPLERALAARLSAKAPPELTGETRFALARALWSKPAERSRSRALARQALADYAHVQAASSPVPDVGAWLRAPTARL
jgi:tetratricopeptide (TPR) repeat protein